MQHSVINTTLKELNKPIIELLQQVRTEATAKDAITAEITRQEELFKKFSTDFEELVALEKAVAELQEQQKLSRDNMEIKMEYYAKRKLYFQQMTKLVKEINTQTVNSNISEIVSIYTEKLGLRAPQSALNKDLITELEADLVVGGDEKRVTLLNKRLEYQKNRIPQLEERLEKIKIGMIRVRLTELVAREFPNNEQLQRYLTSVTAMQARTSTKFSRFKLKKRGADAAAIWYTYNKAKIPFYLMLLSTVIITATLDVSRSFTNTRPFASHIAAMAFVSNQWVSLYFFVIYFIAIIAFFTSFAYTKTRSKWLTISHTLLTIASVVCSILYISVYLSEWGRLSEQPNPIIISSAITSIVIVAASMIFIIASAVFKWIYTDWKYVKVHE